jgi:NADH dehydrogenase/NADH:ubiquinone oxidoreductase subunit G
MLDNLKSSENIGFYIGDSVDEETLKAIQLFNRNIPQSYIESRHNHLSQNSDIANLPIDFASDFGFNSDFEAIENADLCILIGVNPRNEGTLVNTRLRKGVLAGNLTVANFGPSMDLTYPVTHLGNSFNSLLSFVEGQHTYCGELLKAKNPVIIMGTAPFFTDNAGFMQNACYRLKNRFPNLSINLLHAKANEVTSFYSGTICNNLPKHTNLIVAVETDNFPTYEGAQVIYLGSHLREKILSIPGLQVCLPVSSFAEKNGRFKTLTGQTQQTQQAIPSPGYAQSRASFIERFLFYLKESGITVKTRYPTETESNRNSLANPRLKTKQLKPSGVDLIGTLPTLDDEEMLFQSNIICRNSPTLAVRAQVKQWSNFK